MELTLYVPAISCSHCAHTIRMELKELDGVQDVGVDVAAKSVKVTMTEPASEELVRSLLAEIDYPADAWRG